jgi:hypothetical protein
MNITVFWDLTPCNVEVSADVVGEHDPSIFKVVFIRHLKDGGSRYL